MPEISNRLNEEINEVEPFIEDYYPKIEIPEVVASVEEEEKEIKKPKKNKNYPNPYYPYSMYPNPYLYNNDFYRRKRSR